MEKKSSLAQKLCSAPYLVWSAIFIVVPLFVVAYYAFTDRSGSFTLENISQLGTYANTLLRSVWLGLAATAVCLVLAYPMAYIMARSKANVQRTMMVLVMLPMWMNFLIRTYSWMTILADTGIINTALAKIGLGPIHMINTAGAVVLGMVYDFIPFMILPIYSIMSKLDYSLVEAAEDLGGSRLTVFKKIIMPLSLPGVASGITMVFVPSVSTFYISKKLGGSTYFLIGDAIEQQFMSNYNYHLGAALALVLMALIMLCMAIMSRFTGDDEGGGVLI